MQHPKIIALVGMAGSGKGTCTTFISETYHIPVVHFGNMVYEEVERRGLDIVKHEREVREDMRRQEGLTVLAKRAAKRAQEFLDKGEKTVVLDGLYSWSEYKYLKEAFGDDIQVIAVVAPRKLRYARAASRQDARRKYTAEQVEKRDIEEIENLEKGGPIAMADYTILNDTTPDAMLGSLRSVLNNLDL
ncbi:MAG TPA: AAA family ATPase [Candidatus Saccharimonadales bacterium]|nr:AAA family ATPase [Candidatus Saccharimonadales bacterium]